ncbi:hypothetical protein L1887_33805 [Cichorium endivia]|nr:hypothetical protein L1887_33805 [Cichorium endivia]
MVQFNIFLIWVEEIGKERWLFVHFVLLFNNPERAVEYLYFGMSEYYFTTSRSAGGSAPHHLHNQSSGPNSNPLDLFPQVKD